MIIIGKDLGTNADSYLEMKELIYDCMNAQEPDKNLFHTAVIFQTITLFCSLTMRSMN